MGSAPRNNNLVHKSSESDRYAYLQIILLKDGSLHEVHVADCDGGKVDRVERRRQRIHVGRDGVREKVEDGPK